MRQDKLRACECKPEFLPFLPPPQNLLFHPQRFLPNKSKTPLVTSSSALTPSVSYTKRRKVQAPRKTLKILWVGFCFFTSLALCPSTEPSFLSSPSPAISGFAGNEYMHTPKHAHTRTHTEHLFLTLGFSTPSFQTPNSKSLLRPTLLELVCLCELRSRT